MNLTNRIYGRLTVIDRSGKDIKGRLLWLCRCSCGNEIIVKAGNLQSSKVKSCGCLKSHSFVDKTGQRFGYLTVIKREDNKGQSVYWLCKCDCGNSIIVNAGSLSSGNTKSCGCLKLNRVAEMGRSKRLRNSEASFNGLYYQYQVGARRRNLSFSLVEDDFRYLIGKNCFYCGVSPNKLFRAHNYSEEIIYNGIDRVDNTKGYELDNVVPCCESCNRTKRSTTINIARKMISFIDKGDI